MIAPTTGEKKEIRKLLELNEELENYFRNTIIPQLFVDADMVLRRFSPPANLHFRLTESDVGLSLQEIPNLSNIPNLMESIHEVIASNLDLEKEVQTEDKRWFQMNILPYIIKKQNITNGVIVTFIDITGRINDQREIESINADHETFIYAVSHDLRGPLTNMVMLIELMRMSLLKNDMADLTILMKKIEESAHFLKTQMNELTDLARTGSDVNGPAQVVQVDKILEDVKYSLKNQIYQSHAKVTTNLLVPELRISKKNLRSILYNLICNAIKFSVPERTPEIIIRTESCEEFTLLSVEDNGIGIESDRQKEIFSKFTRLRPDIEGTGVGLYILEKMVNNQGGKIEVESKMGEGTTFKIYLKALPAKT